jgi:putative hydrolase of the HAD superfamily
MGAKPAHEIPAFHVGVTGASQGGVPEPRSQTGCGPTAPDWWHTLWRTDRRTERTPPFRLATRNAGTPIGRSVAVCSVPDRHFGVVPPAGCTRLSGMRPHAVLLDFDDTLLDNSVVPESVEQACEKMADAVGDLDRAKLLRANMAAWSGYWPEVERRCWLDELDILDVGREVWRRALHACGHDDPSIVTLAYETHQRIGRAMLRLFDDVPDFLAALDEAGIATALVTNSSTMAQLAKLEAVGLATAFDAVVISGQVGVAKPDPGIFGRALDELHLTAADVWHVGDSLSTDVAGAVAAGIWSVWLNRTGRQLAPSDPRPDGEIASLRELREQLLAGTNDCP